MVLSDNETKVDMLNNKAIAKTVADVIRDCDDRPVSIGVHGDWGAGKSSVLVMVEEELHSKSDEENDIVCIRFNGWQHQGFEDAKIALMSAIISELSKNEKLVGKAKGTFEKLWKNINWLSIAKTAGSAAFSLATGLPPIGLMNNLFDSLKETVVDKVKVTSAIDGIGKYLTDSKIFEDNSMAKEFAEFQSSFEKLLTESKIKKLVVLIDDLDRCLPKGKCFQCIWATMSNVEIIWDFDRRVSKYRFESFCYGPKSCKLYKMGKARSVLYKNRGSSLDSGWLDDLCTEGRGLDE